MKIVIVGGGVSGCCTAINAKNDKNEVIILERNDELLKKLLMTGNGRCNYYNDDQSLIKYHSNSGDVGKIITDSNLDMVKDFFDGLGIIPKIKNGYYYPYSNQASTIRDVLLIKIREKNIKVSTNFLVEKIDKNGDKFIINDNLECDKLVLATGSYAYPKTGSDGMGYDFLKMFGHTIIDVFPSLVALKSDMKYCQKLSGVRADGLVSLYENDVLIKQEFGEVQLTDYGISGICTFNLSYDVARGLDSHKKEVIKVNFVPFIDGNVVEWFDRYSSVVGTCKVRELLERILNKKIVDVVLKVSEISPDKCYDKLDSRSKRILTSTLTDFSFNITSTKGIESGQVCSGGVSLSEIDCNSFQSNVVSGLYITGELLDITGDCGGYNLTICWISGIKSGISIGDLDD